MTTSTLNGRDAATPCTVATDLFLDSIDAALEETPFVYTERVALGDDSKTTVHVFRRAAQYRHQRGQPGLGEARHGRLQASAAVVAAMSGGFFAREAGKPLGDLWIGGKRQSHVPFPGPWHNIRGSLLVDAAACTHRSARPLPSRPDGDLLQAGPAAGHRRQGSSRPATDVEGFSAGSGQFDSDITDGRYPRAAIGYDDTYVYASWSTAGRTATSACRCTELADFMPDRLGVTAALNLDGGGSATLAARDPEGEFHVINNPMDGHNVPTPGGSRELYSAIVFTQR